MSLTPSHTPHCHPNATWRFEEDIPVCAHCGRADGTAEKAGFAERAGLEMGNPSGLEEAQEQLYQCALDIANEDTATPNADRMLHYQHLSSAFWHYNHVLFAKLKDEEYFSQKWRQQQDFSAGIIGRKAAPKTPRPNDHLKLEDIGL